MRQPQWRAEALQSPSSAETVYHAVARAFIEMDTGDKRFLAALSDTARDAAERAGGAGDLDGYALTIPHFWALTHLGPDDGQTMAELARLLICDKSNITKIVDRLEALGWARRAPGYRGDRRFLRVALTPAGRAVRQRVMAAHAEWVRRRFAVFTPEQLAQLESLMALARVGFSLDPEGTARDLASAGAPEPAAR